MMKVKDVIRYYEYLKSKAISPRYDWSYYEDEIHKFLNREIEIKKGEQYED